TPCYSRSPRRRRRRRGTNHRHRLLLRPRRERPCCRRPTEHRYEPAPLHSITSSARANSVSGRVRPSVLAVSQRANSWTPDGSSDRPIALDRHTAAGTDLGVIIPQRHVLNAAIVPERDRVGPPAKPHLEFRPGAVFE